MKNVTTDYRNSMSQPIRNRSYCRVVLTLSDDTTVTFSDDGSYRDNRIVNVTLNEYNSPIAEELPQTDATIILNNRDLYFDPMLETEPASLLKNGLSVTIQFGYDIDNDGTITWLAATPLLLDSWQIGETEASLICVDLFSKLVDTDAICVGNALTIYDYAVAIFEYLGVSYSIDGYSSYFDDPGQEYLITNPIPYAPAGELLQMLANAGHGYLYVDDSGVYHLAKSAVTAPTYTVTSTGENEYSGDYSNIMDDGVDRKLYSILSWDFWKADGETNIFAPTDASNRLADAAWVSEGIGYDPYGEHGDPFLFNVDFALEITLDTTVDASEIRVNTPHTYDGIEDFEPTVCIWLYSASDMENPTVITATQAVATDYFSASNPYSDLKKIKVSNLNESGVNTAHAFNEYTRFVITSVTFGESGTIRDVIKRSQMFAAPTISDENRIKSITVACDVWNIDSENWSTSGTITVPANSTYTFTIEHDAVESANGTITGASGVTLNAVYCGGFATKFVVTNSNAADTSVSYQVYGTSLKSEQKSLTVNYDTSGRDLPWYNPLANFSEAESLADWIYSHYSGKFDIEFDWRGDPKFQAADSVGVERVDGATQIGKIIENEISYGGTIRGRMTVRRVVV